MPEAIIPEPAFEIFKFDTEVVGGQRGRRCDAAAPTFSFPLEGVLAAITPRTRVVFLTNPEQPDRRVDAARGHSNRSRAAVPEEAIVFVDEAYAEFSGATFIPQLPPFPNVIVGRTFSKAFGLAGLRIGCLSARPIGSIRSVSRFRSTASTSPPSSPCRRRSTIERTCADYLGQVAESKALLYAACDRLGLTYWKSGANFVLVARRRTHGGRS